MRVPSSRENARALLEYLLAYGELLPAECAQVWNDATGGPIAGCLDAIRTRGTQLPSGLRTEIQRVVTSASGLGALPEQCVAPEMARWDLDRAGTCLQVLSSSGPAPDSTSVHALSSSTDLAALRRRVAVPDACNSPTALPQLATCLRETHGKVTALVSRIEAELADVRAQRPASAPLSLPMLCDAPYVGVVPYCISPQAPPGAAARCAPPLVGLNPVCFRPVESAASGTETSASECGDLIVETCGWARDVVNNPANALLQTYATCDAGDVEVPSATCDRIHQAIAAAVALACNAVTGNRTVIQVCGMETNEVLPFVLAKVNELCRTVDGQCPPDAQPWIDFIRDLVDRLIGDPPQACASPNVGVQPYCVNPTSLVPVPCPSPTIGVQPYCVNPGALDSVFEALDCSGVDCVPIREPGADFDPGPLDPDTVGYGPPDEVEDLVGDPVGSLLPRAKYKRVAAVFTEFYDDPPHEHLSAARVGLDFHYGGGCVHNPVYNFAQAGARGPYWYVVSSDKNEDKSCAQTYVNAYVHVDNDKGFVGGCFPIYKTHTTYNRTWLYGDPDGSLASTQGGEKKGDCSLFLHHHWRLERLYPEEKCKGDHCGDAIP